MGLVGEDKVNKAVYNIACAGGIASVEGDGDRVDPCGGRSVRGRALAEGQITDINM